jgi:hypothetical protein
MTTTPLTALADDESVEFELVEDEVGFTYDEAYAVLTQGSRATPLVASVTEEFRWVEEAHPRDSDGRFDEKPSAGLGRESFNWLTPRDADEMHREMTADEPWDLDQEEALTIYTGSGYGPVNNRLRAVDSGEDISDRADVEHWNEVTRNIGSAMRPLPYNVKAVRGVYSDAFGVLSITELRDYVGKRFREPGFLSTSTAENYVDSPRGGWARLELDVPEDTPAAYLGSTVGLRGEYELLLDSGTEFVIENVELLDNGGAIVKARVVL